MLEAELSPCPGKNTRGGICVHANPENALRSPKALQKSLSAPGSVPQTGGPAQNISAKLPDSR